MFIWNCVFFAEPIGVLIANHSSLLFNLLDAALAYSKHLSLCVCVHVRETETERDTETDFKVANIFFKNNFLEINSLN